MTVILIDGKNALFRYGFAQRTLQNEDGVKTGAIYGVLNCLLRMKKRYPDAKFVFVWDGEDKHLSWRFKLNSEYQHNRRPKFPGPTGNGTEDLAKIRDYTKAARLVAKTHRKPQKINAELDDRAAILAQIPLLENILSLLGIPQVKVPRVEADDVIAILTMNGLRKLGWKPVIYSADKDFIQLLQYGVTVLRNVDKKDRFAPETTTTVVEKFGCKPIELLKVRAIAGDVTDGLANPVPGIGVKTAAKLVAIGVDPSIEKVGVLNVGKLAPLWEKLFAVWPAVHLNWRLMRLPHHWTDHEFDEATQNLLSVKCRETFESLKYRNVQHIPALKALAELNLQEAIDQRRELFSLQVSR